MSVHDTDGRPVPVEVVIVPPEGHRLIRWIAEPRIGSIATALAHLAVGCAGVAALIVPEDYYWSRSLGAVSADSWGMLLMLGALFGILGALPGRWWLERVGCWLEVAGLIVYELAIWVLQRDPPQLIAFRTALAVAVQIGCISRYIRISGAYLDPRRSTR